MYEVKWSESFSVISDCLWPHGLRVKWSRSVVSGSMWPHRLQPTRLLSPWNFLGKSTGVGCHFLLQGLPDPGIEPGSPVLQSDALPSEPPGKPVKRLINSALNWQNLMSKKQSKEWIPWWFSQDTLSWKTSICRGQTSSLPFDNFLNVTGSYISYTLCRCLCVYLYTPSYLPPHLPNHLYLCEHAHMHVYSVYVCSQSTKCIHFMVSGQLLKCLSQNTMPSL